MLQNFNNSITIMSELSEEVKKEFNTYFKLCCRESDFQLIAAIHDTKKKKKYESDDSILEKPKVVAYVLCNHCNKLSKVTYTYAATYQKEEIDNIDIQRYRGSLMDIHEELIGEKPMLELSFMEDGRLTNIYILDLKNIGTREMFRYSYLFIYAGI